MRPKLTPHQVARFWSKVEVTRYTTQCWPWRKQTQDGYGQFALDGHTYQAGRIALFLFTGQWDTSLRSLHTCDNPRCCNPHHIYLGTHQQNMRDMSHRGRARGGRRSRHVQE